MVYVLAHSVTFETVQELKTAKLMLRDSTQSGDVFQVLSAHE